MGCTHNIKTLSECVAFNLESYFPWSNFTVLNSAYD